MLNLSGKPTLLAAWLFAMIVNIGSPSGETIHAFEKWYQERPEQEVMLEGRIERHEQTLGPAARGGLDYRLLAGESQLAIYTANVAHQLAPFDGENVIIHGKTVDLSEEGGGIELWIGRICLAKN